ncbi:MAG: nitroreductase family protein [Desulfobulbaceae bacterium]|jgi:nitroreductase|nr:nitroreductase family protein [Desulfobulbaceae bacterium]HKJ14578.1 nitroreductase family protein [Desulfobulbales bacterium]MDH3542119.1 nitroreductase family protein [Desulfobulbaceae bacterium]MDH3776671.1 nitroreductase family protein [Desulfobulbaceae bacterium]MDH3783125.1 nitroreductase family protein [Desulfobulbaceae bacterium]
MLYDLISKTRSFRRFVEDEPIAMETLRYLVDLARLGGSARNLQPLKYVLVNTPALKAKIFPHLGWAGYLKEWTGPQEGERPAAYIVCLLDTRLSKEADCDLGIATQNLLLGAAEKGLGGCRIASLAPGLRDVFDLDDHLQVLQVIALGRPAETVFLNEQGPGEDIKYWRDTDQIHHVPKRPLQEIIAGEHD